MDALVLVAALGAVVGASAACCGTASARIVAAEPCCAPAAVGGAAGEPVATGRRIEVELLALDLSTCDRCIGSDQAIAGVIQELAPVFAEAGAELVFRKTVVEDAAQAERLHFRSSPTVRINGRDLPIELRESRCGDCATICGGGAGIDCRVWVWQGREYVAAPRGLIVDAVLTAYAQPPAPASSVEGFVLPENLRTFFAAKQHPASAAGIAPAAGRCCEPGCCAANAVSPKCCAPGGCETKTSRGRADGAR